MLDERTSSRYTDSIRSTGSHRFIDTGGAAADTADPTEVYVEQLLEALAGLPAGDPDRDEIRREVIEYHLPLADRLAHRYARPGHRGEDLVQVARLGLVKAVDGFDPARGTFVGYAIPTIQGELKRYFRDHSWDIRPPRRLQELRAAAQTAIAALAQELGHNPTAAEIAALLQTTDKDVLEALDTSNSCTVTSLNAPVRDVPESCELGELIGDCDPTMESVAERASLSAALARLPQRERRIILMRFVHDMTQSQIADVLGISQMHVSRLLSRTLNDLRAWIEGPDPAAEVQASHHGHGRQVAAAQG